MLEDPQRHSSNPCTDISTIVIVNERTMSHIQICETLDTMAVYKDLTFLVCCCSFRGLKSTTVISLIRAKHMLFLLVL